ncbi:hypothetical protein IEQ34_018311 [Dendrobium chrysotoxum]|uniref:Uncharacterized protein n=1 Tax=Dendrobium chrysotoxum TaxID=161865 RepID=A0AAV7GCX1_DENCH|nr:hypothetical protein IEQ34_018311 [Dendrobium chrysotoxum]
MAYGTAFNIADPEDYPINLSFPSDFDFYWRKSSGPFRYLPSLICIFCIAMVSVSIGSAATARR